MDNFEVIKKYKELLDEGLISQEEFDAKRNELLGAVGADETPEIVVDVSSELSDGTDQIPDMIPDGAPVQGGPAPDSIASLFPDASPAAQAGPQSGPQTGVPQGSKPKGKFPKPAIIGIAAVVVLLLVFLVAGKGGGDGIKDIQGTWNLVAITTNGSSKYNYSNQDFGTLKIDGDKWEMNILESTFKGTYTLNTKDEEEGSIIYVYDFKFEDGGQIKALYSKEHDMITVCTSNSIDVNNSATFKRP